MGTSPDKMTRCVRLCLEILTQFFTKITASSEKFVNKLGLTVGTNNYL